MMGLKLTLKLKPLLAAVLTLLLALAAVCMWGAAAYAEDSPRARLSDYDDVLTDEEEAKLAVKLLATAKSTGCNIGIVITSDLGGKSDKKYADDFLDAVFGEYSDSIVLLYNNDRSSMSYGDWISVTGQAWDMYGDRTDTLFDAVYYGFGDDDNYYSSIESFCSSLIALQRTGSYGGTGYGYGGSDVLTDDMRSGLAYIVIPCVVGLVAAIAAAKAASSGYKKKAPISAAAYLDSSRTRFVERRDDYVNEYTTHVRISSGDHHGGGGGGFRGGHGGGGGHRGGHGGGGGRRR